MRGLMISVLFSKVVLYSLPGILFFLLLTGQASFHYLTWRKDRNAYIPTGIYSELDSQTLRRLGISLDPLGKYYFDNRFIEGLFRGELGDLSNIRFRRQDSLIRQGQSEPFQAYMLNRERFLSSPFLIGIEADNTPILCNKLAAKEMLLAMDTLDMFELMSLSSRFACDCLGFDLQTFRKEALDAASAIRWQNAFGAFLRESLFILKPFQVPSNYNLKFSDFFRFTLFTNMTMSSPDLVPRSRVVQHTIPVFTVLSYFLLAVQAALFALAYQRLIP